MKKFRVKPIKDYGGYLVSENGKIYSFINGDIKELKQVKNQSNGYMQITINNKTFYVHRLVAQAFISNPDNKPQVNHIDENRINNNVSNLEWVTAKENLNYGSHNQKLSNSLKSLNKRGRKNPRARAVVGVNIETGEIISYECISDSHKDGFQRQGICHCCNGKYKYHMGYKWYYAEDYFKNGDDKNE